MTRKHSHYFRPCPYNEVDVYRVLGLFGVTDPCLQHAIKKLLAAGARGGGKDLERDIQEAIDTLERWREMRIEEMTSASFVVSNAKNAMNDGIELHRGTPQYGPRIDDPRR